MVVPGRRPAALDRRRHDVVDALHRAVHRAGLLRPGGRPRRRAASPRGDDQRPVRVDGRRHELDAAALHADVLAGDRARRGTGRGDPRGLERRRLALDRRRHDVDRGQAAGLAGLLHPPGGGSRPLEHAEARAGPRAGPARRRLRVGSRVVAVPMAASGPRPDLGGADHPRGHRHRPGVVRLVPRDLAGRPGSDLLRGDHRLPGDARRQRELGLARHCDQVERRLDPPRLPRDRVRARGARHDLRRDRRGPVPQPRPGRHMGAPQQRAGDHRVRVHREQPQHVAMAHRRDAGQRHRAVARLADVGARGRRGRRRL